MFLSCRLRNRLFTYILISVSHLFLPNKLIYFSNPNVFSYQVVRILWVIGTTCVSHDLLS